MRKRQVTSNLTQKAAKRIYSRSRFSCTHGNHVDDDVGLTMQQIFWEVYERRRSR